MPLVGFSSGADPLYAKLKEMIGPFLWTPLEIFSRTFPDLWITADQLTVISWVLPMTRATKADTRKEKVYTSERWYRARRFGEEFNVKLRSHVAAKLTEAGYRRSPPRIRLHGL